MPNAELKKKIPIRLKIVFIYYSLTAIAALFIIAIQLYTLVPRGIISRETHSQSVINNIFDNFLTLIVSIGILKKAWWGWLGAGIISLTGIIIIGIKFSSLPAWYSLPSLVISMVTIIILIADRQYFGIVKRH
jgi:hypothetical protein